MWYIRSCTYEDLFRTPSHSSAVSNLFLTISGYKSSKPRYQDPMRSSGSGLSPNLGFLPFWADCCPRIQVLMTAKCRGVFSLISQHSHDPLFTRQWFMKCLLSRQFRVGYSEYFKYQTSKSSWFIMFMFTKIYNLPVSLLLY